jgi:hypothetical protein
MTRRFSHTVLVAGFALAFAPAWAFAHAVGVSCAIRGDQIEVEAYFDDDSPAVKAKVQVVNANMEIVASGVTDEKGAWNFPRPAPGKYEVRLDAGAGHRAKKTIEVPIATPIECAIGTLQGTGLRVRDTAPAASAGQTTIGAGPTRTEFTRMPWENILIGFGIIGGLSGTFLLVSMLRKTGKAKGEPTA